MNHKLNSLNLSSKNVSQAHFWVRLDQFLGQFLGQWGQMKNNLTHNLTHDFLKILETKMLSYQRF